jgi:hypothetical protein
MNRVQITREKTIEKNLSKIPRNQFFFPKKSNFFCKKYIFPKKSDFFPKHSEKIENFYLFSMSSPSLDKKRWVNIISKLLTFENFNFRFTLIKAIFAVVTTSNFLLDRPLKSMLVITALKL